MLSTEIQINFQTAVLNWNHH